MARYSVTTDIRHWRESSGRWRHGPKLRGIIGTKRDAILFSVGANASHGLRRSNEDKRKAVMTLLNDSEWATWADVAIAKACGVSDKTVAAHRASSEIPKIASESVTRTVERNGKTYEQNTANIGKAKPTAHVPPADIPQPAPPKPIAASIEELVALRESSTCDIPK